MQFRPRQFNLKLGFVFRAASLCRVLATNRQGTVRGKEKASTDTVGPSRRRVFHQGRCFHGLHHDVLNSIEVTLRRSTSRLQEVVRTSGNQVSTSVPPLASRWGSHSSTVEHYVKMNDSLSKCCIVPIKPGISDHVLCRIRMIVLKIWSDFIPTLWGRMKKIICI